MINTGSVTEVKCHYQYNLRNIANVLPYMVNNDRILYSFIDDFLNIAVLSKTAMPAISLKSCRKTSMFREAVIQRLRLANI